MCRFKKNKLYVSIYNIIEMYEFYPWLSAEVSNFISTLPEKRVVLFNRRTLYCLCRTTKNKQQKTSRKRRYVYRLYVKVEAEINHRSYKFTSIMHRKATHLGPKLQCILKVKVDLDIFKYVTLNVELIASIDAVLMVKATEKMKL